MPAQRSPSLRLALATASLAIAVLAAAAFVVAAALVPVPPAALPLLVLACIGAPLATALEYARTAAAVHEPQARLRRELERLPETPHPLGF